MAATPDSATDTLDQHDETHQLARNRTRRLMQGTFATILSKFVIVLTGAIAIPITIRYLGPESFGIWTTISTILSMLLVLDLGVANSLTNFLSQAYASQDRTRATTYATTAVVIMVGFALVLAVVAALAWPALHWNSLFRLPASSPNTVLLSRAVAAAFVVFLVGLPANLAPRILGGYQEIRTANLFQAFGSLFNLASVVILVRLHAGLVALVVASSAALVGSNLLCLAWIWAFHKPWLLPRAAHFNARAARAMMQTGSEFFVLQIAALVVFNSDNLVVTHYLGPAQVASYSLAWKLVSYAAIAQTLVAPALWPAYSEAFARGDLAWVRQTFARTMAITMGIALLCCALFAWQGRTIIRVWAGPSAVPGQALMLLMCLWTIISTFMNNTSTVLVARGDTRLQAWCSLASAVLNIALSIYWVQRIGAVGVILGTIVSYLVLLIVPQTWKVYKVLTASS